MDGQAGPQDPRRLLAQGVDVDNRHAGFRRTLDEVGRPAFSCRLAAVPDGDDQVGVLDDDSADGVVRRRRGVAPAGENHDPLRRSDQPVVLVARPALGEVPLIVGDGERKRDGQRYPLIECCKCGMTVCAFRQGREKHWPHRRVGKNVGVEGPRGFASRSDRAKDRGDVRSNSCRRGGRDAVGPVADDTHS